jgi:hypothetical protein
MMPRINDEWLRARGLPTSGEELKEAMMTKYEDPNEEVWTKVEFSTMSKEQLIEAIKEFNENLVALRCDGAGTFTLMDEERNSDYVRR